MPSDSLLFSVFASLVREVRAVSCKTVLVLWSFCASFIPRPIHTTMLISNAALMLKSRLFARSVANIARNFDKCIVIIKYYSTDVRTCQRVCSDKGMK